MKVLFTNIYYEPETEDRRPGGRAVGENQKESFTLCGQAMLHRVDAMIVLVVMVVVVLLVVGLVIPSMRLKDKSGAYVKEKITEKTFSHFLYLLYGVESSISR